MVARGRCGAREEYHRRVQRTGPGLRRRSATIGHALSALGFLAGGWGWLGANGWRATADRFEFIGEGGVLEFGAAEMCFVVCGTVVSIVGLAWSLRAISEPEHELSSEKREM